MWIAWAIYATVIVLILTLVFNPFSANADYYDVGATWHYQPVICIITPPTYENFTKHEVVKNTKSWETELKKNNIDFDYRIIIPKTLNQTKDCTVGVEWVNGISGEEKEPIGKAVCRWSDEIMFSCIVKMNEKYRGHPAYKNTLIHELGHVWGIGHRLPFECENIAGIVVTNDIMIWQGTQFHKIINDDILVMYQTYGKNGWEGENNSHYRYVIKRGCV